MIAVIVNKRRSEPRPVAIPCDYVEVDDGFITIHKGHEHYMYPTGWYRLAGTNSDDVN